MEGHDDGLEAWCRATGLRIPRPPGSAADWTCLLDVVGPFRALARRLGEPLLADATLRAWLEALGRPTHPAEGRALLLVTPIPKEPEPTGVLLRLLGHPEPTVRGGAARAIGACDPPRAAEALRQAARGSEPVRGEALRALGLVGAPHDLPSLLEGADHVGLRLEAVGRLVARHGGELPSGDGAVGSWLEAVRTVDRPRLTQGLRDDGLREGLCACVAARHEHALALVGLLVDRLREAPDPGRGPGLARALGRAGEEGVEALAGMLRHDAWEVRAGAAMALAFAGPAAAQVDGALRSALSDDDADVQREAALARQLAGRDPVGMTARLARRVVRTHGFVERVQELGGSLGPFDAVLFGREPSPELLARLTSPHDVDVSTVAALWIGRRGAWGATTLDAMATDRHQRVPLPLRRGAAAGRLASGGPPSEGGVLARLLLAHDPLQPGRGVDGSALAAHGAELAALALGDPDAGIRWSAVQALRGLGAASAPFLPVLDRVAVTDPVAEVRQEARWARPPRFRAADPASRLAVVLHGGGDGSASGAAELLALSREAPELAFSLARGLLDHDRRPLAVAAARVVGKAAARDAAAAVRWAHEGLRRLADGGWAQREVGAYLLGALGGSVPEGLRDEVLEALSAAAASDPDEDVQAAAEAASAAWRRG